MIEDASITTARLELVPIPLSVHTAINRLTLDETTMVDLDVLVPYAITEDWPQCVPSSWRQRMLERDPTLLPWLTRAVVLRDQEQAVGAIGYHDRPDERGMAEVGYQVIPEYRRKGIAREALYGLLGWGGANGVKVVRLTVSPDNEPSLGLVQELGLRHVGEQMDEIDGLELIFEGDLPI